MTSVGMLLPIEPGAGPAKIATALATMADAGIDHVVVGDHVSFFGGYGFDGLVHATAVSMLHPTLPVHTGVYLLALRHPVLVARQLSSLASFAPGRLVFGVGLGGEDRHEVESAGVDPRTRGRRMEECLTLLPPLLAGDSVTFHGEFFDLDDVRVLPPPPQPVPIVVGGRSDAAIERAGRRADGWLGIWVSPERYERSVALFDEAGTDRVERRPPRHAMTVWCGIGSEPDAARVAVATAMEALYQTPFERFERYVPYGPPEVVAEFLEAYRQKGCTTFNLLARPAPGQDLVEGVAAVRSALMRR